VTDPDNKSNGKVKRRSTTSPVVPVASKGGDQSAVAGETPRDVFWVSCRGQDSLSIRRRGGFCAVVPMFAGQLRVGLSVTSRERTCSLVCLSAVGVVAYDGF
jgi:hypothetical protein